MFITNNHASFHLWQNFFQQQEVSKHYGNDCRLPKPGLPKFLTQPNILIFLYSNSFSEKSKPTKICYTFQKKQTSQIRLKKPITKPTN